MIIRVLVGNCVKCGAPIYDKATVEKMSASFTPTPHYFLDYNGNPKASCQCFIGLKPTL